MADDGKVGVEWVSISDLMSGVVGLMVVLFAVAALRVTTAEQEATDARSKIAADQRRAIEEKAAALTAKEAGITSVFRSIASQLEQRGLAEIVEVDVEGHRLKLRDATFESGSACVGEHARTALRAAAPKLQEILQANPEREVFIEGHTDSNPLLNSTSSRQTACARFDDNYTLSTARAREARTVVVEDWKETLRVRVAVAGFGDSRPISGADPRSRIQRRVEISVREVEAVGKQKTAGLPPLE